MCKSKHKLEICTWAGCCEVCYLTLRGCQGEVAQLLQACLLPSNRPPSQQVCSQVFAENKYAYTQAQKCTWVLFTIIHNCPNYSQLKSPAISKWVRLLHCSSEQNMPAVKGDGPGGSHTHARAFAHTPVGVLCSPGWSQNHCVAKDGLEFLCVHTWTCSYVHTHVEVTVGHLSSVTCHLLFPGSSLTEPV